MSTEELAHAAQPIDQLDDLLVAHPFGNSGYITEQMHVAFKRRLGKIAPQVAEAGQLLTTLNACDSYGQYRVLGDMVVRCAVQHAHKQVETGQPYGLSLDRCRAVFAATVGQIDDGHYGPLGFGLSTRLGSRPRDGWIWSDERPDDVFGEAFRFVVQDNYGGLPTSLSAQETAMLAKGTQLLIDVLPHVTQSALSHAHLVAVFSSQGVWGTRSSSSEFRLSGTVFLSQRLLANVWWVAEHLLHEALHQQLYDLRQGHTLLAPSFERDGAPTICSLWNMPDATHNNYWDVHRSLAAFHVYVHLALLATLAEQRRDELEPIHGAIAMTPSRTALVRAHYLGEQLRTSLWQELGPAGQQVVEWFATVLDSLDPSPPPHGSYVHLLLDRYWREAKEVAFLSTEGQGPPPPVDELAKVALREVGATCLALGQADADSDAASFDTALSSVFDTSAAVFAPGDAPGMQFARVRGLIAKTLIDASADGYRLAENWAADEIVRDMVEDSSERLMALVGR